MSARGERIDLRRVDRLWRCTSCGYLAYSAPYGTLYDDEGEDAGGFLDDCPDCGSVSEPWQWCGGLGRAERERIMAGLAAKPLPGSGVDAEKKQP